MMPWQLQGARSNERFQRGQGFSRLQPGTYGKYFISTSLRLFLFGRQEFHAVTGFFLHSATLAKPAGVKSDESNATENQRARTHTHFVFLLTSRRRTVEIFSTLTFISFFYEAKFYKGDDSNTWKRHMTITISGKKYFVLLSDNELQKCTC